MGEEWETKKILILVKTYPLPSTGYQETVCTAGITDKGELIRLYPISYRHLNDNQKFEKWRWIEARVKRNPQDLRPESFKVDYDSIKLLNKIESKKPEQRIEWITPLCSSSMEEIQEKNSVYATSLGIFKPDKVRLIIKKAENPDWTDEERNVLNQTSFGHQDIAPLEKIPYNFSFKYKCANENCKGHTMRITDWELCQAYRNFARKYKRRWPKMLEDKYLNMFNDTETNTYFIVGSVHRWVDKFIIIGVLNINNYNLLFPQTSLFGAKM